MKKIVAAFDGLKFSESTLEYAIDIAEKNKAHLVGLFLEDLAYHSYKIYDLITEEGGGMDTKRRHLDKKDEKTRAVAVVEFEAACRKSGLDYTVHKDRNIAIQELLKESIYADLVIIDRSETVAHHAENAPTSFIHELLPDVQCPVLLVPHQFEPIDKLILLFDGEPSSVHAIKMLSYTLSGFKKYPAEIVTVNANKQDLHVPDSRLMKEFIRRHFPTATYTTLKGLAETEIVDYLKGQPGNPLVVLGAYRRSKVSRWFRPSMADTLMKELKFPLFIAHNK
jgi:nucleotide-binding universal stress UspA family protein